MLARIHSNHNNSTDFITADSNFGVAAAAAETEPSSRLAFDYSPCGSQCHSESGTTAAAAGSACCDYPPAPFETARTPFAASPVVASAWEAAASHPCASAGRAPPDEALSSFETAPWHWLVDGLAAVGARDSFDLPARGNSLRSVP